MLNNLLWHQNLGPLAPNSTLRNHNDNQESVFRENTWLPLRLKDKKNFGFPFTQKSVLRI